MSFNAAGHLESLTPAQRSAVTFDAGPLVVLSGPGTGKTRVIIHRIAHLVTPTSDGGRGVEPEQVVAVTFTVKSATEMRERLARLLGATVAERVQVRTFHGLGQRLIARFPDLLGLPAMPRLIDSAERRVLLRDLIDAHDLLPESAGLGREGVLDEVTRFIETIWNNAITPERCAEYASRERAAIDRGDSIDDVERQARSLALRRFEDMTRLTALFERACRERGWFSMSELLTLPIRLLRTSPLAASIVRSEWRHVIVDEFQDVNAAQIELLRLLAPPAAGAGPGPDLCIVGDDDQAIYEFRGADDRAFQKFARIWPGHQTIELADNFRSAPCVIDVANDIMSRAAASSRFRPDKSIVPADVPGPPGWQEDAPGEPAIVQAVKLSHDFDDADVISAMVLAELRRRPGMTLDQVAVIGRNWRDLARIAAAFDLHQIDYSMRERRDVADDDGVHDVLAWLELLTDPGATWAVRRALWRPPVSIATEEAARWERLYKAARSRRGTGADSDAPTESFIEWLRWHADRADLLAPPPRPDDLAGLRLLLRMHDQLRADASSLRAEEAIFRVMTTIDAAHADLRSGAALAARVAALVAVLRFARERQSRLPAPGDLAAFLAYYRDLDDKERDFTSEWEGRIDGPRTDSDAGDDEGRGVQLLTAHGAKGLEFDTVFVPRITPRHGFPTIKVETPALPDDQHLIDRAGDTRSPADRKEAEERRLFYVACTRAKRRLILLAKWNKGASSSVHLLEELIRDRDHGPAIDVHAQADVLASATAAGVPGITTSAPRGALEREASGLAPAPPPREAIARARSDAREAAAHALAGVDRSAISADDLHAAGEVLRDAAGRLAIIGAIDRAEPAPEWITESASWVALDASLRRAHHPAPAPAAGAYPFRALPPPLHLSHQQISDFRSCPRCYYAKHVLGLSEPSSDRASFGFVAHKAIERFYREWTAAENADVPTPRPDADRLVALGRELFLAQTPRYREVDRSELRRLEAQLRVFHRRLHSETLHVSEIEQEIEFDYPLDGHVHRFMARIDRLDQLAPTPGRAGGTRIVDYKTGEPTRKLLEPAPDDLQLGIYALAVQSRMGDTPLTGVAEYWVLATGDRGVIDLGELRLDKVRKEIDGVIRQMIAGDFARSSERTCRGMCAIFGD
ncbi:MAG: ATP-dependent helicase [Phycisphaerales bacterium]